MEVRSLSIPSLQRQYDEGATVAAVVDALAARIEAYRKIDPAVWIALVDRDALAARARELDRVAPEERHRLPLFGVPYAVKDNIDVVGMTTTAACPGFGYRATRSAAIVERAQRAGAVLVGKTNLDQFATGLVGTRSPYGAPRCVFNGDFISGGSSSGSAVAVAAGLVSFAFGTDTAGSGRVPAAMNNLVGLKPTPGLVSTAGIVPACASLDCPSVFALDTGDALSVLRVLSDGNGAAHWGETAPLIWALADSSQEFFGDDEACALYARAIALCGEAGLAVERFDYRPYADVARSLYQGAWVRERYEAVGAAIEAGIEGVVEPVRSIILGGRNYSEADLLAARHAREAQKRAFGELGGGPAALLLPTTPAAYRVSEIEADPVALNARAGHYTNFVNLLGLAAIAIPAGFRRSNGVPFGVTLVGAGGADLALAQLAHRLHVLFENSSGSERARVDKRPADDTIRLAVVGAHLRGQPLNHQLTDLGARFVEQTWTDARYRLYALDTAPPKPGLVRMARGEPGAMIEVEVWDIPGPRFYEFFRQVPAPLALGTVTLADGRAVNGFVGEALVAGIGKDITHLGAWRAYMSQRAREA